MKARDVMTRAPRTVEPETTILTALALMRDGGIRHLVVVDDAGRLAGVVSNRDYRKVLDSTDAAGVIHGIRDVKIKDIMTPGRSLVTAGPDTPLLDVARLMVGKKVGCVPVVDDVRRPIGILTQADVIEKLLSLHSA